MAKELLLGAHVSASGKLHLAFDRARELGADCLQIFTRAPGRWQGRPLSPNEVEEFRRRHRAAGSPPIFAHDLYLTNLAAPDPRVREASLGSLTREVERGWALGLNGLVCHLGAHLGQGEEAGLERYAQGLGEVLEATRATPLPILLETTAGQGTCLGHRFEHLARVLDRLDRDRRLGICLDTCHLHAAGYDLTSLQGYRQTMREFERLLGRERLRLLHLNDCQKELGCRVDRHAHIGQGSIGDRGFRRLLKDPRFGGLPAVVETPEHESMHRVNLERLRALAQESS